MRQVASTASTTLSLDPRMMPRCLGCGYSLLGLTLHRCPECGKPFDPANPKTMLLPGAIGPIAYVLLRPVNKSIRILAWIATALLLLGYPYTVDSIIPWLGMLGALGEIVWLALLLYWLARLLLAIPISLYHRRSLHTLPKGWLKKWCFPIPVLFPATLLAFMCGIAVHLDFVLSKPMLDQAVHVTLTTGDESWLEKVGHCCVQRTWYGVRIYRHDVMPCEGFAYAYPNPPASFCSTFHHLEGNWYYFTNNSYYYPYMFSPQWLADHRLF